MKTRIITAIVGILVLMSQSLGRGATQRANRVVRQAILMGLGVGAAFGVILLALGRQNLTCFEVHDLGGAKAYLKKNFPRCVCLYLPYEQCQEIQPQLKHDKIFFVENPRNLEYLATLLQ